ncbi:MAG: DUF58 domain-containing protein [Lachnospiraceae bacterium]
MKRFRNLIRYIIVVALDVWIMLMFHSYINFLLLVGLVMLPIISYYCTKMVANSVTLNIETPIEPMKKGENFILRFIFHNPTWFPVLNVIVVPIVENRFYLEYGEHTLNAPLRMHQDTEVEYLVEMEHCGRFVVSVSRICMWDLTGLFEIKIPVSLEKECLIFPNGDACYQEAGVMYEQGLTEAMESKGKGYDFSDISGIREYIPGDKLQNIHWKLSVKKDILMVKERVSVSAQQLNVLLELVNDDQMCLEYILELFDGITKAFVEMNLTFTVFYYSMKSGNLMEYFIGNEVERKNCLEMILYDHSYGDLGVVENSFLKAYPNHTYLYVGKEQFNDGENVIKGKGKSVAVLKEL